MSRTEVYIMLLASLPAVGPLFAEKQTPISRFRLDKRLSMLDEEDLALVTAIERALDWRRIEDDVMGEEIIGRVDEALSLTTSKTIHRLVERRMEFRTCIAALRRRAAGEGPPTGEKGWGYGRWRNRILKQWNAPGLGLEHVFPWLIDANRMLCEGDPYGLERLILEVAYRDLARRGGQHHFDIEAVVIYVLKWAVIDRWSRYNSEAAERRFARLLQAGLDDAAQLAIFPTPPTRARA